MVRYILNNQLLTPDELAAFSYEGFEYAPELVEAAFPHFIRFFMKKIVLFHKKTNDILNIFCIFASIRKICAGRDKRTDT